MIEWNQEKLIANETALERELSILRLEQQISRLTSGRIRDLKVQAVGEGVLLQGRTATYYAKQLATQVAKEWNSFNCLENMIEVE